MFPYYGGKRMLAPHYPPPRESLIVEPFAGGAAYAIYHLRKDPTLRALLYEKNARVYGLWRRLLAMTPEAVLALPVFDSGDMTDDFLIMTTEYSNAIAGCRKVTVTPRMAARIPHMLKDVAWTLSLVQGRVDVIYGDYREAPDIRATWFIDPPYQTQVGLSATAKGNGYGHFRASRLDFGVLAEWCRTRQGQVIVAEQAGADWLPFTPLRVMRDSQGQQKTEVWWTNQQESSLFDD